MKNIILLVVLSLVLNISYSQDVEIIPNEVYRTEFTFFESPLVFENGKIENHSGNKFLWEDAFNVFYNPYYFNSIEESISYSKDLSRESYLAFKNRMSLEQVQNLNPIYILGFYELLFKQSNSRVLVLIRASIFNNEKTDDGDFRKAFQSNGSSGTNFFIYDSSKQGYLNYSVDDFFNLSAPYMSSPEFNNFLIGTPNGLEQCYLKEGAKIIKDHNPSQIEDKRLNGASKLPKSELLPWLKDCESDTDGDGIKNCEDTTPNKALPFNIIKVTRKTNIGGQLCAGGTTINLEIDKKGNNVVFTKLHSSVSKYVEAIGQGSGANMYSAFFYLRKCHPSEMLVGQDPAEETNFKLSNGEAVLEYEYNGETKYFKIDDIQSQ